MTVQDIISVTEARLICGEEQLDQRVEYGFASDLMSDVLRQEANGLLLVTGLANLQTLRTAEMADITCIIFVRNKKANEQMISLAIEHGIVLMECSYSMFKTAGLLYQAGLKPVF